MVQIAPDTDKRASVYRVTEWALFRQSSCIIQSIKEMPHQKPEAVLNLGPLSRLHSELSEKSLILVH